MRGAGASGSGGPGEAQPHAAAAAGWAAGEPEVVWHACDPREALAALAASEGGLARPDAEARSRTVGPNELPRAPVPSLLAIVVRQFRDPLVYILGIAGLLSAGIGHYADAGFILAVVAIDVAIGAVQERRAEISSHALERLLRQTATALRDGEVQEVDATELVPGDIALLEPGARVPADIRLLASHGLEIDESLLTGESEPAGKDASWIGAPHAPLADRLNMAYAGTFATRGRGRGVVVATGARTEIGQMARQIAATPGGKPPLLLRMERFTRTVGIATFAAAAFIALFGIWIGERPAEMFLFAVALAVSAIPEGLPVALSIALAISTDRMARRGVIVRRLSAVEGLGSCTYIAADKTGTLTANELTVGRALLPGMIRLEVTGEGYAPYGEVLHGGKPIPAELGADLERLALAAALCNEGHLHARHGEWSWRGDPTDVALLAFAHKAGLPADRLQDEWPQIGAIPFEPELRYAATWHVRDGEGRLFVKGAPERVLAMCRREPGEPGQERLAALHAAAEALAADGFRVLALAAGTGASARTDAIAGTGPTARAAELSGLEFLGLLGLRDPLRPGARAAVARCREAGIEVAMITGDHPVTALAIARELGLAARPEEVVTGTQLADAAPGEIGRLALGARVFARVSPAQKLAVVEAVARAGHFVAVTGDGVNDAPALRTAHIGVAMGKRGTDVAREAAALVISDDNFATIVSGIEEGRAAYDSVRRVVFLLVSTGAAEVLLVALALLGGLPLPLTAVQILWLNLVTNGIQDVALAFEPAEGNALARPPRPPGEPVLDRLMVARTVISALVMGGVTFLTYRTLLAAGWDLPGARNAALMLMVLFEVVQVGNARSETASILRLSPLRNPFLLIGTVLAFAVHMGALYLPAARGVLETAPLDAATLGVLAALSVTLAAAIEVHKRIWNIGSARQLGDS